MKVEVCTEVGDDLVEAMARLVPQLSSSSPPPTAGQLQEIVDHDACYLLVATEDNTFMGSMTLVVFPIPTGIRAWIEDVVVDESARGKGVGAALNTEAISLAQKLGAKSIDLTSRPSREAANRLYQRLGFEKRESSVYRFMG